MTDTALNFKQFSAYTIKPAEISTTADIEHCLTHLKENAERFATLTLDDRIELANAMQRGCLEVADEMVKAESEYKDLKLDTPIETQAWTLAPLFIVRQLRLIRESLQAIKETGNTRVGKVGKTSDHRLSVNVFPANAIDGILFKDVTIDVHLAPDVTEDKLESERARFYKSPDHNGRVVAVLGAGNIASIPAMDVLTKMFNEGKVCVLKMNPVNAYIGPLLEKAFSEAIKQGFLAVVYGGVEESQYLINHDLIDEVHITGSDKTYDAIIWGHDEQQNDRRLANTPLMTKPITAELGNVTPVIVVPGPYSDKEMAFQADDIVTAFTMNASFLCCVPVTLITAKGWPQRESLMSKVEQSLQSVPTRKAYYPGAKERWHALTAGSHNVKIIGEVDDDHLPWALIEGLSDKAGHPIYENEPFCPVLTETRIDTTDTIEFLDRAVEFVNNKLWGSLTANLIVHPKTLKDPKVAEAFERAISRLKYGVVTVNGFNGMVFASGVAPWGAYPGSKPQDIQSGNGWVHNTVMLEGIEKAVMRYPLVSFPKPPLHFNHRKGHKVFRKMIDLEAHASWIKLPSVVFNAMQG